jgi:ABC-type Fe3+/spermidine/putrescine transport system ATPase subunit
VTKRYGSQTAVDALSLSVARGGFFSILGPSVARRRCCG